MDYLECIANVECINKYVINNAKKEIIHWCEKDAAVAEFVSHVLDDDSFIGSVLRDFLYQLGFTIGMNPYHDASTLVELQSFMANFFYDDAYYYIEKRGTNYIVLHSDMFEDSAQGPEKLLECAKDKIATNKNRTKGIYQNFVHEIKKQNLHTRKYIIKETRILENKYLLRDDENIKELFSKKIFSFDAGWDLHYNRKGYSLEFTEVKGA